MLLPIRNNAIMNKFLQLHQELHARPIPDIRVGSTIYHQAMFRDSEMILSERAHLDDLVRTVSANVQSAGDSHVRIDLGGNSLRVEFHNEFTGYTFIKNSTEDFDAPPDRYVIDSDWIGRIPGGTVNRLQIHVEAVDHYSPEQEVEKRFKSSSLIASDVSDSQMRIWSDYLVSPRGNTRFLIQCKTDDTDRIGRAVQRVIDIENYRMLALIGLQTAKAIAPTLSAIEMSLEKLMRSFQTIDTIGGERVLLDELIQLSAEVELIKGRAINRFRATEAYAEIMTDRLREIRETKVEGVFSIGAFLMRRSEPAFRTCRARRDRILELSLRVSRAAELLRTRINVQIEEQNQKLLQSVDQRASLQNRLQLTIEWFSIIALSVYALQLLGFMLAAIADVYPAINVTRVTGVLTVPVVITIGFIVGRIRRQYTDPK